MSELVSAWRLQRLIDCSGLMTLQSDRMQTCSELSSVTTVTMKRAVIAEGSQTAQGSQTAELETLSDCLVTAVGNTDGSGDKGLCPSAKPPLVCMSKIVHYVKQVSAYFPAVNPKALAINSTIKFAVCKPLINPYL